MLPMPYVVYRYLDNFFYLRELFFCSSFVLLLFLVAVSRSLVLLSLHIRSTSVFNMCYSKIREKKTRRKTDSYNMEFISAGVQVA